MIHEYKAKGLIPTQPKKKKKKTTSFIKFFPLNLKALNTYPFVKFEGYYQR